MKNKYLYLSVCLIFTLFYSPVFGEWNFGIGTGPAMLSIDGDMGIHTNIAGPVKLAVEADPDDINDVTDSALGLNGYARTGRWTFNAAYSKLKLEGTAKNENSRLKLDFDVTGAQFLTSYMVYGNHLFKFNLVGGVRYTRHEFSGNFYHGEASQPRKIDNEWTDAVVGVSAVVPFTETLSWKTSVDGGFGGSEGTYTANTGVTWRFFRGWSATLFYNFCAVDYEDGSPGDEDWYLYDVDETTVGLNILFNW